MSGFKNALCLAGLDRPGFRHSGGRGNECLRHAGHPGPHRACGRWEWFGASWHKVVKDIKTGQVYYDWVPIEKVKAMKKLFWKCETCGTLHPGPAIELDGAVCMCGTGKGVWKPFERDYVREATVIEVGRPRKKVMA